VEVTSRTFDARGFVTLENIALISSHSSCDLIEDPESPLRYRSHTNSLLLGEEATSEIFHVLIGTQNASYDIWAGAEHRASNTHSRVYGLGLGADASKIIYRGVIDMKKGIAQVDGAQEGKFLIISPKAEIDAIPELDIASKDVASTHKLSVSHIRDSDLFYAKTRGIPEAAGRALAIEGFFGALFHRIKKDDMMESVRTRIAALITE
jgi:Fe-S cluster assembly scaffold protein SufB